MFLCQTRAADGNWVNLFAEDFRRRFVELTGGPFREMPIALALAIASAGAKSTEGDTALPKLDSKTVGKTQETLIYL